MVLDDWKYNIIETVVHKQNAEVYSTRLANKAMLYVILMLRARLGTQTFGSTESRVRCTRDEL